MVGWAARTLAVVCLVVTTVSWHPRSHAEAGELAVTVGLGTLLNSTTVSTGEVFTVAPELMGAIRFGLDDFFQVGLSTMVGVGISPDHDAGLVTQTYAEVYAFLDVFTWVPYLVAGAGVVFRQPSPEEIEAPGVGGARADLGVHLGFGLDYRPERDWSVGAQLRYVLLVSDLSRSAPTLDVAATLTFYLD